MVQSLSFIFVPGAWHRPETWSQVTSELQLKGNRCIAVALPSTLGDNAVGFGDDVKAVQEAIRAETVQGHDVILVVHSYGGQVGNSAVRGFARNPHDSSLPLDGAPSGPGYVIGLVMMATGFTITGVSFLDALGGKPPPQWTADTKTGFATIVADPRDMLYHDLPEEECSLWVSRLTSQSLKALATGGEYAYAGWRDVPCWYLAMMQDHALSPEAQKFLVKTAREAGADVTLREILSRPTETVDFIAEAARYFVEKQPERRFS